MLTIQISLVVIAVCTVLLTLVPLLIAWKFYTLMRVITRIVKDFQQEFQPLAEEIQDLASYAVEVAEGALGEVEGFTDSVAGVRERAARMGALAEVLEEDLERATIRLFSLLSGIGRFLRNLFTGRTD